MKRLILNADDFAFNAAVSHGIVTLARLGRLSATSAMTLSPRWQQDAAALKELQGQIDVGLHLDWTSPFATQQATHGSSLPRAMLTAVLGGFNHAKARVVIEQQLDAFEQVWQAPPSHIDGHQHVHQFKGIRDALVQVMTQRYGYLPAAQKPYLRISKNPAKQGGLKAKVIATLNSNATKRIADKAMIKPSIGLFGVYGFEGGQNAYGQLMAQWLAAAPADCIIMCHPALGRVAAGDVDDGIATARQWEFDYLASDAFAQALVAAQVRLR